MAKADDSRQRLRRRAARALLVAFVLTAELAPVAHLATHRNDHTHGPELAVEHDHEDAAELTPAERAWLDGGEPPPVSGEADEEHGRGEPHSHGSPFDDHGHDSIAHFALATLPGPPPPIVPPPPEAVAPPPNHAPRRHDAPALLQPPVRGPPA